VQDRVIVVGGGAREHAFARAFAASGAEVVVAPGNAGTAKEHRNAAVKADDKDALVALAESLRPRLVFVGPEVPLALGLVDALGARGIRAFGPSQAAARLESSKSFMKRFLQRHDIPTAAFEVFTDPALARAYVIAASRPLVVKADGLAAGKGVVVAGDAAEAVDAIDRMMVERVFGAAGATVVIEELLPGEEVSFHVVADGERFEVLPAAQDHKRALDGDRGANTGGMGAYAPAPLVDDRLSGVILERIIAPTLAGLAREGFPFRGALFAGLMVHQGEPMTLEFNVRFGDPETSVLVPLYTGSWLELLAGAADGRLPPPPPVAPPRAALAVVMASEGYPATPATGDVIRGLDLPELTGSFVLHAGTSLAVDGSVVSAGGRVLTVGAVARTLAEAREGAYAAVARIHFRGEHHRSDIGARALTSGPASTRPAPRY
jgi:phosphoribosylamine--glycine ligase